MSGYCPDCGNTVCFCDKTTIFLRAKVNKLEAENTKLKEQDKIMSGVIKTYLEIAKKLQAENAELKQKLSSVWKEAEEFYLED